MHPLLGWESATFSQSRGSLGGGYLGVGDGALVAFVCPTSVFCAVEVASYAFPSLTIAIN